MTLTGLNIRIAAGLVAFLGIIPALSGQQTGGVLQQNQQAGMQQPGVTAGQPDAGIDQYGHMLDREPVAPSFLPLADDHQKYLNELLDHWEQTSNQVKRLTCDFQRWDYDPTHCAWRDPADNRLAAYRMALGKIQYGEPDKADCRSQQIWDFAGTKEDLGREANYVQNTAEQANERWMCDGRAIYEFDYVNKRLYEVDIPPEMQGKALAQSPLPFLFGAKRTDLEERFWMRVATPQGVTNEYWLEAWPKRKEDAVNYHHVEIIIAKEDFLPKYIHIYNRDYDAASNPVSHFFMFSNRIVNDQLTGLQDFFRVFIRPTTQIGWERVPLNRLQATSGNPAQGIADPRVGTQPPNAGAVTQDR